MSDIWDAKQYLKFAAERLRPASDLIARVDSVDPKLIYDIGCGAGNVTLLIQERWPKAHIIGIDNSDAMLQQARDRSAVIEWIKADLQTWQAPAPADIVFSNATLQWVSQHQQIIPGLLQMVAMEGVLAIEMPNNYLAPSHLAILETVQAGAWKDKLQPYLRYITSSSGKLVGPVADPDFYYEILAPFVKRLDIWQTEYLQILQGDNPIVEWVMGTGLRPIVSALAEPEKSQFIAEYTARVKQYYPSNSAGKTLFAFKRLFIIAKK